MVHISEVGDLPFTNLCNIEFDLFYKQTIEFDIFHVSIKLICFVHFTI
jgi:hypothetical protein